MKKTIIATFVIAPVLFLTGCVTDTTYYANNTTARYVYAQPNNLYYGGWNNIGYVGYRGGYYNRVGYVGYRGGYYNRGWGNHRGWGGGWNAHRGWGGHRR